MSKLSTFVIDCKTDDLSKAAGFWAAALRRELSPPEPGDDKYRDLMMAPAEPLVMIQRVQHESRIHLDIEAADVEAEVERLKQLGAKEVERIRTWVVMQAPTGQRFCVVRQQRPLHEPAPFSATPVHARLQALAGHYQGTTRTFLDPNNPPDESEDRLFIEPVLGGRWLRMQWFGRCMNKPRSGELTLGYHIDADAYEMTWVDSFHSGSAILWFTGAAKQDGSIIVQGTYAAGTERWGWRHELHPSADGIRMRATNIAPDGTEYPAIETDWTRAHTNR
jgi:hypothetical protein